MNFVFVSKGGWMFNKYTSDLREIIKYGNFSFKLLLSLEKNRFKLFKL